MSVDRVFHQLFYSWGFIAFKYRLLCFIFPLLLTVGLSLGFLNIKAQTTYNTEYVFSPENAPWRREFAVLSNHWPLKEDDFWPGKSYDYKGFNDIVVWGKLVDGHRPNMLDVAYLLELQRINQYILKNITVDVPVGNETFKITYRDLCMTYEWKCYENDHITMLLPKEYWGDFDGEIGAFASEIAEREVRVTYPIAWRGTEPIYLGSVVGAPNVIDDKGTFNYAKAIRITFNLREEHVANVSWLWKHKLTEFLTQPPEASEILEFGLSHNDSLSDGLLEVSKELTPKFSVTFILLTFFVTLSSLTTLRRENFKGIDWVRSKPLLGFAGVITPVLAAICAFGLILLCGSLYNDIVNISPFLLISIGVDDMFVMSAAWQRTNPKLTPAHRMALALSEAGVSITITSLTDFLSFTIGCITTMPGVRLFCMYTAVGVLFNYCFQLTFFTSIMAFAGDVEEKERHAILFVHAIDPDDADTTTEKFILSGTTTRRRRISKAKNAIAPSLETTPDAKFKTIDLNSENDDLEADKAAAKKPVELDPNLPTHIDKDTLVAKFFREYYGPFLLSTVTKVCVFLIYLIYLGLAITGCFMVKEGLSPTVLIKDDFYLHKFFIMMDETFWEQGLQIQVVVNDPPDFANQTQSDQFFEMLDKYQNSYYTMPQNATMFWYYAFNKSLEEDFTGQSIPYPNNTVDWYIRCREWLLVAGGRRLWLKDMVWGENYENQTDYNTLYAFRLQLGLRHYKTPTDHKNSAIMMRAVAAEYPQFNVTTFHEYYPFADQYLVLMPSLYQNTGIAVVCMIIISFLLIPNYLTAFCICAAIISIDVGVIGFMTYWGVRLESVSMITIVMSIGFSVNLSAHISYAYVKAEGTGQQKAITALETLGWAVFQGAFSTILGMLVLTTVDAYIVSVFFKTVFLVIAFGLMHSIIFLPILLTLVLPGARPREDHSKSDPWDAKCVNNQQDSTNVSA